MQAGMFSGPHLPHVKNEYVVIYLEGLYQELNEKTVLIGKILEYLQTAISFSPFTLSACFEIVPGLHTVVSNKCAYVW